MSNVLIVEDGTEYLDFFRLFLAGEHEYLHACCCREALARLDQESISALVLDMRFDRTPLEDLDGELEQVALAYFGGDLSRAQRYLQDGQGAIILAQIRRHGHEQPALFVTDMPTRKLENLRSLYRRVHAVPTFDAAAIRHELALAMGCEG